MKDNHDGKTARDFKSVIFDFDYTLVDSSEGVIECVNYALRNMNLPAASGGDIRQTIGLSIGDTLRRLTESSCQADQIDQFSKFFTEKADQVMQQQMVLFDSVKPTVKALLDGGLTLGIVSTKFRYRIEAFLEKEDIAHVFAVVVGGEDVVSHKPDPAGMQMAIERLGCKPSDVVYVGDSTVDAETARNAATPFIAVLSGVTPRVAFDGNVPYAIIENLWRLPALILNTA